MGVVAEIPASSEICLAGHRFIFNQIEKKIAVLPQLSEEDFSLEQHYLGGVYFRKITIPAGAVLTGRIYKVDHIEVMTRGKIAILSADGGEKVYEGENIIQAKAGKRQAGLAIEETVWMTAIACPEMPLEEMLEHISVQHYAEMS